MSTRSVFVLRDWGRERCRNPFYWMLRDELRTMQTGTAVPMNLGVSLQDRATDTAASAAGARARCEASNFRCEQAVTDERAEEYCAYVGDAGSHSVWKSEHKGYVDTVVHVAKDLPRAAESFMAVNRLAQLDEQLDDTLLLRLESIGGLFENPLVAADAESFWTRFFKSQNDLMKDTLTDRDEALREAFAKLWNVQRTQARPMFATFLNEFGGDLKQFVKSDWPHVLRDRLGLTHLSGTPGKPLPVALICYRLDEARLARAAAAKKGAVASFTRPTVLDTEMSAAFVPAPLLGGNRSYGYTLDLAGSDIPDSFTPELLTFPIDYQPRHIRALGFITRRHALAEGADILAARNRHMQGLRHLLGGNEFGEVLP